MFKKIYLAALLIILVVSSVFAQTQLTLEEILLQTEKQTTAYQEAFHDLLANETKTFEDYDNNEKLQKQSLVEADFLVYQSSKNPKLSFEMRNVTKVDSQPIPNASANSDQFFAELSKTTTLKSELEKIQQTSSKYDKTFDVSGLTLYEGIILSSNLRPAIEFTLLGNETVEGNEVYLVGYHQTKPSPFILVNQKGAELNDPGLEFQVDVPGDLKKNGVFLRGKLWIDTKTFQIWREERELTVKADEPLVVLKTDLEYQPSKYEILVPKQITMIFNQLKKKGGKYTAVKDTRIVFDYTNFRKTETDVKILDDTEN
jgi:hypothetical protein